LVEETINIESAFLESNEGCREDTAELVEEQWWTYLFSSRASSAFGFLSKTLHSDEAILYG
jgi:hypothetical protein